MPEYPMVEESLVGMIPLTIEEIEQQKLEALRKARPDWIGTKLEVPGGMRQKQWEKFKSKIQKGDKIFWFDNNAWHQLAGRQGYALVRNGKVVDAHVTRLS